MSIVSIRLNKAEEHIFTEYAKFHGKSLSSLFKKSLIEKIEDELDMKLISEGKEYNQQHTETYTHEQIKQELDL